MTFSVNKGLKILEICLNKREKNKILLYFSSTHSLYCSSISHIPCTYLPRCIFVGFPSDDRLPTTFPRIHFIYFPAQFHLFFRTHVPGTVSSILTSFLFFFMISDDDVNVGAMTYQVVQPPLRYLPSHRPCMDNTAAPALSLSSK